ncbi:MAG: heme NO-binding domain-containing protein [Rubrivivax sp.]|nr:heme NO-binding domain-containing protein [Rubrivivax sp.]
MKGVVFTQFLEFVASRFGEDTVDDIIEACALQSGGAYTSVGTYSHEEMHALAGALAERCGLPAAELVRDFGHHLAGSFEHGHPEFFRRSGSYFDVLASVEEHIHVEVRKLYPDAELPTFTVVERSATRMVMDYRSPRRLGALAEGLLRGSARHFGVEAAVQAQPQGEHAIRFIIETR